MSISISAGVFLDNESLGLNVGYYDHRITNTEIAGVTIR